LIEQSETELRKIRKTEKSLKPKFGGARMAKTTADAEDAYTGTSAAETPVAETPAYETPSMGAKRSDDNVIFVGRKPSMAYVLGVITQFNEGNSEVHVKARGKAISRAVDVAEIVRRRFLSDVMIKSIDIGTEERELEDKTKINVSAIEIVLGK
jgi:DNA-binding protein Alba